MTAIFFAVVALIVYGSLYPWHFYVPPAPVSPVEILFRSWIFPAVFDRRYLADVLINLALYLPVGITGFFALRRRIQSRELRLACIVLFGFLLSALIEMTQIFVPGRRCSAIDLFNNTLGTLAGAVPALLFEAAVGLKWLPERRRLADRSAGALLLIWLGSLLFPAFPVMWLGVFRQKLATMAEAPLFDPVPMVSAAVSWYVAGLLLRRAGLGRAWVWASVLLIPGQFFIMLRVPSLAELTGALIGVALFAWRGDFPMGWVFLGVLVLRGLAPFQLGPPHEFSCVPFGGFLEMEWQTGFRVLLEKAWYFGAAIWALPEARMPLPGAIGFVAGTALLLEVVQVWLPGRTAEITDPILAVLLGLAIWSLGRRPPMQGNSYSGGPGESHYERS